MTFGSSLRQARLSAGYTIAEVSAQTRIREHVLQDLENDNFASLGGIAYARGHVRSVAKFIGADSDFLVAELEAASGEIDRPMIDLLTENFATQPPREKIRISYKTLSILAGSVLGLLILVPAVTALFSGSAKTPSSSVELASSKNTSNDFQSLSGNPIVATKTSDVAVVVTANNGSTWLGVTDSAGTQVFNGKLSTGQSQTFNDNQLLRFVIGNAGAVNLTVNGEDLGTPGTTGEVVHLEFGPGATNKG